jgi:hypothetical protein
VTAFVTKQMNKTQSLDGICGPQHAKHMSGHGVSRFLKAEASHSVRQAYKHVIAQELNEVDPEVLDFENNHGQHGDGAELRHLVADVQKIMQDEVRLCKDGQHDCTNRVYGSGNRCMKCQAALEE